MLSPSLLQEFSRLARAWASRPVLLTQVLITVTGAANPLLAPVHSRRRNANNCRRSFPSAFSYINPAVSASLFPLVRGLNFGPITRSRGSPRNGLFLHPANGISPVCRTRAPGICIPSNHPPFGPQGSPGSWFGGVGALRMGGHVTQEGQSDLLPQEFGPGAESGAPGGCT